MVQDDISSAASNSRLALADSTKMVLRRSVGMTVGMTMGILPKNIAGMIREQLGQRLETRRDKKDKKHR